VRQPPRSQHPAEGDLLRFLVAATSRQENRQIVRHLLTRCPACAAALRAMRPEPPVDPGAYDGALERFAARLRGLASAGEGGPLAASLISGGATRRWISG
jgi:hypothetical protein